MGDTIATLQIGESGIIEDFSLDLIPLCLLEMGCLPGKGSSLNSNCSTKRSIIH